MRVHGIRLLAGSEVDILKNGKLDLDNEVLAQLDVVVVSVHSYMNLERDEMTERMLAAIENPYTQIVGIPPAACCCCARASPTTWNESSMPRANTAWPWNATRRPNASI